MRLSMPQPAAISMPDKDAAYGDQSGREENPAADRASTLSDSDELSVSSLFTQNRSRIVGTYLLFCVENLLRLAQPFALGWAINDLLVGSTTGLFVLIGQHVLHLLIGLGRQAFDTRVFTSIYSKLATRMIVEQRGRGVDVSRVAARASLSREYVEFFERSIPMLMRSLFSIVGSLIMLAWYDWMVVAACIVLLAPTAWLNRIYSRRTRRLSRRLHDQLEREVDVITPADEKSVREHFNRVAETRVRMSDAEAINFGLMETFILGAIILVLLRATGLPNLQAGDIFAIFRYLMLLLMGLDQVPRLVQQASRLRDVDQRIGKRDSLS